MRLRHFQLAVAVSMAFSWATLCESAYPQNQPAYRDTKLSVERRVADLLSRMTLEEKVAQLQASWQNRGVQPDASRFFVDTKGVFQPERAASLLKLGLGEIARPSEGRGPREMAEFTNTVQKWVKENTRLGIPILFHEECLHGHAAPRGTAYPQPIALASTWDPALIEAVFTATAAEVRARGAQQCLTPVLDLAREPRWGRTEETYGEDPYLVTKIGLAAIYGLQGRAGVVDTSHVLATAKHFAVHGQPEGGTNVGPGNYSERVVREYFLKPFEAAVKQAHVQSVMASYNEIDGIPSHSNKHLLDEVLRREWGFDGVLVSDYFGVSELKTLHHVVATDEEAAKLALESGVDVDLPFGVHYQTLVAQVKSGSVPLADVDRAVARVLRVKFNLGLFDNPFADPALAERVTNNPEHRELAVRAARESIVLLKNENHLLPLDLKKYKSIAVVGPNAGAVHLGGYSSDPGRGVSVLQGIQSAVPADVRVLYSEGCKITESEPDWNADKVVLGDPKENVKRIAEAVGVAQQADLVILVLGENEQTSREAWATNHLGDRDDLNLLGSQDELAKAVAATGKPTVVLLLHGRPNSINYIAESVPAILDGWYLGQEGGTAAADVLFGRVNPSGKLPITVPRSVGQLPDYYYQKPSAKRGFLGSTTAPLFPFGWGLSYSTFKYGNLRLSATAISPQGQTVASVDVSNTGDVGGDEVVQLYIHDEVSSVTRPVKELRGFRRLHLNAGETKTVEFPLGFDDLSFLDRDMRRVVEPGVFEVMAGGNSVDVIRTKLVVAK